MFGHCHTKNEMDNVVEQIKDLLHEADLSVQVYFDADSSPYLLNGREIHLHKTNDWRETYQLSHELLHQVFFVNNRIKRADVMWIEEIVCESFSIFCLLYFELDDIDKWFGYLYPDFYRIFCGVHSVRSVDSIEILNKFLSGYKTLEILQFIHPTVLQILSIIQKDFSQLLSFKKYADFLSGDVLKKDTTNLIADALYVFQLSICGT